MHPYNQETILMLPDPPPCSDWELGMTLAANEKADYRHHVPTWQLSVGNGRHAELS